MNKEDLIKKWLDNDLDTEELRAFEQLEDYKELTLLDRSLKSFKSPEFSIDDNYKRLNSKLELNTQKSKNWYKHLIRIAAVFTICYSLYYYTTTQDTNINTLIAEQVNIELPDASKVDLNANSLLTFNKNNWTDDRLVTLNGEAFFKVAKGKKFDVITEHGTVSVLGTQFNVKQRNDYFEVTCYEGLVAVTYKNNKVELKPGHQLTVVNGALFTTEKEIAIQPSWLLGESSFDNVSLKHVLLELKNQYDVKVMTHNINTSRVFTGSFTHKNLDLALKSITIPLNLSFNKSGNSIVIKRE